VSTNSSSAWYSLPAHASCDNTQRLVYDLIPLVHHEEVGVSPLGLQALLPMLDCPPQLLYRHQYLAQSRVHHSLARVQTCHPRNFLLVFEDKLKHSAQHLATSEEACLSPLYLRGFGFGDCAVDTVGRRGVDAPKSFTGCRGVALDQG
jgi:hypothetical protein